MTPRHSHLALRLCGTALLLASCAATAAMQGAQQKRPLYVPGELIVKYKADARPDQRSSALHALTAQEEEPHLGGSSRMSLVRLPAGTDVMQGVRQLEASGTVEYAEPNYYRYPTAVTFTVKTTGLGVCTHPGYAIAPAACVYPNDPGFGQQWYAENVSEPHADVGLTAAWGLFCDPTGSTCSRNPSKVSSFKVAIIDDGFDLTNPDLKSNFLPGTSCTGSSCVATSGSAARATKTDGTEDHGTFVASTLAALGSNGEAMAGVLWSAKIVPIKSDLTDSSIVAGIEYAVNYGGVKVINESFGGPIPSQAEYDALVDAQNAGILVVVSAGNSDSDNDRAGAAYPANYAGQTVIFPHVDAQGDPTPGKVTTKPGLANVIAAGASDSTDKLTVWSQWGSFDVTLLAPGDSITALTRGGHGALALVSGTSFSSPITAGTAALVGQYLQLNSNPAQPDWHDLKAHLLNGSERSQNATAPAAIDGRSATGRLNAYQAMQDVTHGVMVVRGVTLDDSASGDDDGEIDPGETADIKVTVANAGPDETDVQGTLSYAGSDGLATVTGGTVDVTSGISHTGTSPNVIDGTATMSFATSFGSIGGNQSLLFKLHLTTASGGDETRYFYLEAGSLADGVTISGSLTRNVYDDFQDFHITLPSGAKNLVIWSTTPGGVDIDLIAMKDRLPQYLETIGVDNPSSDPEFQQYIEPNSQTSGREDGDESIAYDGLKNPFDAGKRPDTSAGTYHVVVVNFAGLAHQPYTLTACYAQPGSDEVTFDGNYEYDEAAGNATLTLLRSGSTAAVSVGYSTHDGGVDAGNKSARAGTNYSSTTGTVKWAAGDSSPKTFTVPLINTGKIAKGSAAYLHFNVTLGNATGGVKLGCIDKTDVAIGNPDSVFPSSGGSSGGGGGGGGGTPPPAKSGGGGMTGLLSLLALTGALLHRRRMIR